MIKHLRNKKQLETEKNNMTIHDWLFKESIENKPRKIYNPKSLQQTAKDIFKLDDKQLNKELI